MNDRKIIMALGWVWGILGVPFWLVLVADACLSMHGPWWLFFGTSAVFVWWVYLMLTAFVAPCPFKYAEHMRSRLYFRTLSHVRRADVHVIYRRNGTHDAHACFKNDGAQGNLTEVWE